jgi:hypothetical protein
MATELRVVSPAPEPPPDSPPCKPPRFLTARQWTEYHAFLRWRNRGSPPDDEWADWFAAASQLEQEFAQAQAENRDWLEENTALLIRQQPGSVGKYVAVASRTDPKVLAVAGDWEAALRNGLESHKLQKLAADQNLPMAVLVTVAPLADL